MKRPVGEAEAVPASKRPATGLVESATTSAADAAEVDSLAQGFQSFPKVEVHSHLGGSVRVQTVEELFRVQGRTDAAQRAQAMVIPRGRDGVPVEPLPFEGFAIVHEAGALDGVLKCKKCIREYLEDCSADGVAYVELRTGGGDLPFLEAILEAFEEAREVVDCTPQLNLSMKRDKDPKEAWQVAQNAVTLRQRGLPVVAVDFCGVDTHSYVFTKAFRAGVDVAKAAGLAFVPHFAELSGEKDLHDILDAGPARLGHAVFMDELPEVGRRIRGATIPVECCLVNNLNTMRRDGHVPDPCDGPAGRYHKMFLRWVAEGHPFVLCTDNRTHTGSLSDNYRCAASAIGDSVEGVRSSAWHMANAAVDCILAGDSVKAAIRERLKAHQWCPEEAQHAGISAAASRQALQRILARSTAAPDGQDFKPK